MRGLSAVSTEKLAHSSENHYLLFYWLKGTLFVPETNNKHTLHWKKQPQIPNHLSCQTKITKVTTDPSVVLTTWVTLFMVREACSLHAPPPPPWAAEALHPSLRRSQIRASGNPCRASLLLKKLPPLPSTTEVKKTCHLEDFLSVTFIVPSK